MFETHDNLGFQLMHTSHSCRIPCNVPSVDASAPHPTALYYIRYPDACPGTFDVKAVFTQEDDSTGLVLERRFVLAADSTDLAITTKFTSVAPGRIRVNHWGRTFVPGGGIVLVPLPHGEDFKG